jgi:hypothetical protein
MGSVHNLATVANIENAVDRSLVVWFELFRSERIDATVAPSGQSMFQSLLSVGTLSKALDEASFKQVEAFLSSKREGR